MPSFLHRSPSSTPVPAGDTGDMTTSTHISGIADDAVIPAGDPHAAPVGSWGPDILGPGFQAQTLPLLPDERGDDAVATLVRYLPQEDPLALPGTPTTPRVIYLYLHGWNDYFFQAHMARELAQAGAAFYALDLRRYGRSLRRGQMMGWVTSLTDYDEDMGVALSVIRREQGAELPLVLAGHSTGGLTASLWAHRHPGALAGLVLNSPWLETQGTEVIRLLGEPVVNTLARRDPTMALIPRSWDALTPEDRDKIFSFSSPWDELREGPLPDASWAKDCYATGWPKNEAWVRRPTPPVRPGWLQAILAGHARVAQGLDIRCPILCMTSARSHLSVGWDQQSRSTDTVIDVELTAKRALGLGSLVTVARFDGGVHDLTLSSPPVREQVFSTVRRWLAAYVLA